MEDLLCVWQQPLLESSGGGLMEGAPHPQHQDKQGHIRAARVRSESHRQGRAHEELPSPVSHPLQAFNQGYRLGESSKSLEEPQVELLKHLVSPTFPEESTANLREWRASADHLLTLTTPYIPDIKQKSSGTI